MLPIPPSRGVIYDRNGVLLADNKPSFNLTFTRERVHSVKEVIENLVEILKLGEDEHEQFMQAVRRTRKPFEPVTLIFGLSEEQIAHIAVNQYRLPGMSVDAQFVRDYPLGKHFAHSIGYVGRINEAEVKALDAIEYRGTQSVGKTGVEKFYETQLHGHVGYEEVETNAQGRIMRVLRRQDSVPGQDIVLTLDAGLQQVAEKALAGRRGAVVALEPSSGEVLAMVSNPSFNPNLFVKGIAYSKYAELRDSIDKPLFNRALRGLYSPGSTIKPEVALAGLNEGEITSESKVFDPGYYQLPNHTHKFRNWNRNGDGWVDLNLAMMRSNDTYFYDLANKLGVSRLHEFLSKFGLGQKVSLDIPEEAAGLMPSAEWKRIARRQPWFPGETLILGIGQGYMQVTPLQLAQATSLLASKGVWHRPHLALTVGGEPPVDQHPMQDVKLKDPRSWREINKAMQMVMHDSRGVGRLVAKGAPYHIAGKSGTAQVVAIRQGERYDREKTHERHRDNALFVGFAPAENPSIVVAVLIENGEAGGRVAGPVVREVMDAWLLDDNGDLKEEYAGGDRKISPRA